ncbi:MAG: methyl-accepting chemotaxis protein [Deltaproteobacteria bacterium]|nr:methyl-accepting chemotaxis protein [Deltaproteobacteria bacterium]
MTFLNLNWKKSIQTKINLVLLILTTLILIAFGVYDHSITKMKMTRELNSLSDLVATRLSRSMVVALWEVSKEMGIANAKSEMAEKRIYSIVVRETDKEEAFVAIRRNDKNWDVSEFDGDLKGDFISNSMDITRENEKLGSVDIFITQKFMQKALNGNLFKLTIKILVLDLLLVIGMSLVVKKVLARPLNQILGRVRDIAEGGGDLTMRIEAESQDEVGRLADLINIFLGNLQQMIQNISGNADTLNTSSSDLSTLANQMSDGADQMSNRANTVAAASEEMSTNMDSVAAAMEEASTNIGVVATSAEEMTATINEIAQNSEKARNITNEAVTQAHNASERVDELGKAAQEIGKVTEAITEISEQTNLLALNATIEAARAGEAGKGFAVVANEIKELARQTAAATREIKEQIEGIQASTSGTVKEIGNILKVINDVNDIVSTIAAAVEEQSVTTKEIASNVSQASQGIQEVNENVAQSNTVSKDIAREITDVNQATAEISNSSSQVNLSADEMSGLAAQLQEMVGRFKV